MPATRTPWRCGARAGPTRRRETTVPAQSDATERVVLVVCDGVTTAPHSDRASLAAADDAAHHMAGGARPGRAACRSAATNRADRRVRRRMPGRPGRGAGRDPGAGRPDDGTVVHVRRRHRRRRRARSRLVRGFPRLLDRPTTARRAQLSVDHSLASAMIEAGAHPTGGRAGSDRAHDHTVARRRQLRTGGRHRDDVDRLPRMGGRVLGRPVELRDRGRDAAGHARRCGGRRRRRTDRGRRVPRRAANDSGRPRQRDRGPGPPRGVGRRSPLGR